MITIREAGEVCWAHHLRCPESICWESCRCTLYRTFKGPWHLTSDAQQRCAKWLEVAQRVCVAAWPHESRSGRQIRFPSGGWFPSGLQPPNGWSDLVFFEWFIHTIAKRVEVDFFFFKGLWHYGAWFNILLVENWIVSESFSSFTVTTSMRSVLFCFMSITSLVCHLYHRYV